MEELKVIYRMMDALWKLCKRYQGHALTEKEWEAFVEDGKALREQFRTEGEEMDMLFRGLFFAIQDYYVRKGKKT